MRQVIAVAAVAAIALVTATSARAQATTTFVSGNGLDSNPCTVTAPCRSFQHAHDMTAAGGQITMLEPAGYGAVTIIKAIAIVNDGGGEAGINDTGLTATAITINAGASDVVTLRGLTVNGVIGNGFRGIQFNTGGTLNIQNCVIRGFGNFGVLFAPSVSAAITITDTILANNSNGIGIAPTGGAVTASLERVTAIANSVDGILFSPSGTATISGTIVDSAAIANGPSSGGNGFFLSAGSAAATIALVNSQAIRNQVGVNSGSGTIVLSKVMIVGNTVNGYVSASDETFGDNYIIDTAHSGSLTSIGLQ